MQQNTISTLQAMATRKLAGEKIFYNQNSRTSWNATHLYDQEPTTSLQVFSLLQFIGRGAVNHSPNFGVIVKL